MEETPPHPVDHPQEADVLDVSPDEPMTAEVWDGLDFSATVRRAMVSEDAELQKCGGPQNLVEARSFELEAEEKTTGVADLVLLYLQETGMIPLLTPADEARLSMQMQDAKARLTEILRACLPVLDSA
jgi:hypothetical protein